MDKKLGAVSGGLGIVRVMAAAWLISVMISAVGMGVNLLGRVRPKGQTREYPHYTTTAAGRVARVWFVINNFFVIKA